jgi:hypothetical protein
MSTVIVAVAKFEQDYIEEWVIYHLAMGFDRIYLYDNEDVPTYSKILKQFGSRVIITHAKGNDYAIGIQYMALAHFMENFVTQHNIKYVLHSDIDEFVCLKKHPNIQEFIKEYFLPNIAGISICWRYFGSSGLIKKTDEPVTLRFRRCALKGDKLMKTLFKPEFVTGFVCCHNVNPKEGYYIIATNGVVTTAAENPDMDTSVIQMNHYYCKTIPEFFYSKSRGRADLAGGMKETYGLSSDSPLDINLINRYLKNNNNDVEDLTAYNFYMGIQYNIMVSQQTPQEPTSS